jgi:hypothetical protein
MERMTIHRALSELKLMDSRISNQTRELEPCGIYQKGKLINNHIKEEDFAKKAQSLYQSVSDLITRKNKIKTAIVESNSITKVVIADREMSVADAINFKNIIKYKYDLLEVLSSKYKQSLAEMNRSNLTVENNVQRILEATFGKENVKVGKEDLDAVRKPYMESNEFHLFDPLKVLEKIEVLSKEIEEFKVEVDAVLSEINAITYIEI